MKRIKEVILEFSFVFNVLAFTNIVFLLASVGYEDELKPLQLVLAVLVILFLFARAYILIINRQYDQLRTQYVHWLFESAVVFAIAGFQAVNPVVSAVLLMIGVIQTLIVVLIAFRKAVN